MSVNADIGKLDLDNFIFIGNKIADKIYEIPKDDLKFFKAQRKRIIENEELRQQLGAIVLHLQNLSVYQDPRYNEMSLIPLLDKIRKWDNEQ